MKLKSIQIAIFLILCTLKTIAQDSLIVTLNKADELFIKNNLQILAQELNINNSKAQEIQAKLYPNPNVTLEVNAYDPQNKKVFHVGNGGQSSFQIQQLILLGGKRDKEIKLAKTNTKIAELVFEDLIRQLKFQLHSLLRACFQQEILIKKYDLQINQLDTIITSFETQVNKNNLPLKDLIRLKSLSIQLSNERSELYKNKTLLMNDLQVLLNTKSYIIPEITYTEQYYIKNIKSDTLLKLAQSNRPDYKIVLENQTLAEQYIKFQRSLAVPDVSVYSSYNQRGGAFYNEINAGVTMQLPVFNRNQGNILIAKNEKKLAQLNQKQLLLSIENEILNNINIYEQSKKEYLKVNDLYSKDFDFTFKSISENFKKRNISLLEFVDFFEAYNNTQVEMYKSKLNLFNSAEMLNYSVSQDLF